MNQEIKKALLNAAEEVLGLPSDEMEENMDLNLIESEILDSVGCAYLITTVSDILHKNLPIGKFKAEEFTSLNTIGAAIERIIG